MTATYWDRSELESFARGEETDLDKVRHQIPALLKQVDILRTENTKKTQHIRDLLRGSEDAS